MLEQEYHAHSRRKYLMIAVGVVLTLVAAYVFTTLGMKEAGAFQTVDAIARYFDGTIATGADAAMNKIILLLRLPRVLLALIAGAGLALAGALMQSVTRNYLVSPFTLGISSAAALGASLGETAGAGDSEGCAEGASLAATGAGGVAGTVGEASAGATGGVAGCSATTSPAGGVVGSSARAVGLASPISVIAASVPTMDRQECFITSSLRARSSIV